jgi:hypothetical protein
MKFQGSSGRRLRGWLMIHVANTWVGREGTVGSVASNRPWDTMRPNRRRLVAVWLATGSAGKESTTFIGGCSPRFRASWGEGTRHRQWGRDCDRQIPSLCHKGGRSTEGTGGSCIREATSVNRIFSGTGIGAVWPTMRRARGIQSIAVARQLAGGEPPAEGSPRNASMLWAGG